MKTAAASLPLTPVRPARPQALAGEPVQSRGLPGVLGKAAAVVAGGALAYPAASLAAQGARTVGMLSGQFALSALPQVGLPPQVLPFLSAMIGNGIALGALGGLAAGVLTGAGLGLFAASSSGQKIDDALQAAEEQEAERKGVLARFFHPMKASGREIAFHASEMHRAESFGEAVKEGAAMGSTFGDHVGGVTGRIQGALMGAGLGFAGAIPLALLATQLAGPLPPLALLGVAAPAVLAGGYLGHKVGEPAGQVVGSAAGAAAGAVTGAVYHAGHRLVKALRG